MKHMGATNIVNWQNQRLIESKHGLLEFLVGLGGERALHMLINQLYLKIVFFFFG